MEIRISPHFERRYKKLPSSLKSKVKACEKIFKANPFDTRLDTHKLHGERHNEWSYSITRSYRVVFVFVTGTVILYLDVGTHDELYRR